MSRSPSPRPRGRSSAAERRPPAGRRLLGPAAAVALVGVTVGLATAGLRAVDDAVVTEAGSGSTGTGGYGW